MITASHNPYSWNGIKYKASYGSSHCLPSSRKLKAISKSCSAPNVAPLPPQKNLIQPLEPREPYLDTLKNCGTGKASRLGIPLRL